MENNETKRVNTGCKLPFAFCSVDKTNELKQINVYDFSGRTVHQLNISDLTDDGEYTSTVISGIHDQEGHKDGKTGTYVSQQVFADMVVAFILLNTVAPREAYGFKRM